MGKTNFPKALVDQLNQHGLTKAKTKSSTETGFTLVELIIVVAIIAILVAVMIPLYGNYVEKARLETAQANVHSMMEAIEINKISFSLDNLDGYSSLFPNGSNGKYKAFDKAIFEQMGDPDKKRYNIGISVPDGVQYVWIRYFPDPENQSEFYYFENGELLTHVS